MEQNQFEGLEELEQEPVKEVVDERKEYEKLLLAEANRECYEKAVNLVNCGCFNKKQEPTMDFSKYTTIPNKKKYKGLYTLYQDKETLDLLFVCPLVENNKGDVDEDKSMAPYAYDVLYIETMDYETYKAVLHAAKNNLSSKINVLYRASFVCFFVLLAFALYYIIYTMIISAAGGFFSAFAQACYGAGAYLVGAVLMLPLLVITSIKYKKYKDQQ